MAYSSIQWVLSPCESILIRRGGRIWHRLVSFEEWLQALEDASSAAASAEGKLDLDVGENPAIKLLDAFRGFVQTKRAGQGHLVYETKRLLEQSRTGGGVGSGILLDDRWC
ncbi:hypothetical protein E4U58_001080 [Claviceps cyperi]|nr:hypothetical protein E4U58_001080 [Claviceps cyperi]